MKTSQELRQRQHLSLTPQLQQAIRLLALSGQELEQEIRDILDANPLIEYDSTSDLQEKKSETISPSFETETTLKHHLLLQMELCSFSERERFIANTLIDAISEDGYLTCSLEEMQESLRMQGYGQFECAEIEVVLLTIQQWEPFGVGARNLSECLMIQLNLLPSATVNLEAAKQLVNHHLALLGKRDFAKLKTLLKLSQKDLEGIIRLLLQCDPKPGRKIGSVKRSESIIPDLIVRDKNDDFVVELNMNVIHNLRINTEYASLLKRADTARDASFLREYCREAEWFIKSLKNRYATLLKVARCIVEQQKAFLEHGEEQMKGLILQDIARLTDLHESTISRATTHKYIYTPRGVFELKYFFSNEIQTASGNESATAIRAMIKKLISEESPKEPLSDSHLTKILSRRGISVSRRTIAKYREALNIPSSHERRHLSINLEGVDVWNTPFK